MLLALLNTGPRLPKTPNPSHQCRCCFHPGRALIDAFCLNRKATLDTGETVQTATELIIALRRLYPDVITPSEPAISKHSKKHIVRTGALMLKDGVLSYPNGSAVPGYGFMQSLDAAINLGFRNILEHPEKISAANLVDFMKLKWQIQNGLQDQDEYAQGWLDVLQSSKEKKEKRAGDKRKFNRFTTGQVESEDVQINDEEAIDGEYASVIGNQN